MAKSRLRQDQTHTVGSAIDDTLTPTDHDANALDLQDTLNYLASQVADITGETNWEDAPALSIAAIDAKTFLDEKLALREIQNLTAITVSNGQNWEVLSVAGGEIPASRNLKAVGASTKGLVTAQHGGTFGAAHSLAEVTGDNAISPKNLLTVVDAATLDPIDDSNDRRIWALLQHEAGATDGAVWTDITPERAQVSFVTPNATGDDLIACPVADIENLEVKIGFTDRQDLDSWTEQDFLKRMAFVDFDPGGAAVGVTLANAVANQGATPFTQATAINWRIADSQVLGFKTSDGARTLLAVAPAAAGDEVEVNADTLDVNVGAAGVVDVDNGITVDSGGTPINVGVTPGQIDAGAAALKVASSAGDVELEAGANVVLDATADVVVDGVSLDADFTDDSHLDMRANAAGSKTLRVLAANDGAGASVLDLASEDGDLRFQTTREATPLPLDDATAGPISGVAGGSHASVAAAIAAAAGLGGVDLTMKRFVAGSNYAQGVNVPAATFDQTGFTLDMSGNASTMFVFLNGRVLQGAAGTGADVYPGTTPANGDLKFDFPAGIQTGDVIISIGLKQ